jgi:purine nucleosidase
MQLIVDTDAGIDDAIALLMLLSYPAAKLLAITTVMGNVPLSQATQNVSTILDIVQAPTIPIYQGCPKPLLQYQPQDARYVHGDDGLGGMGRLNGYRPAEADHASLALARLVAQYPGQLTLLTLGPLTNIALAAHLYPDFLKNLGRFVMMGGAIEGHGNTTSPAEFNIAVDPEAAKVVFEACTRINLKIELISWEATLAHPISLEDWDNIIKGESPAARFVQGLTDYTKQRMATTNRTRFLWPDPLAAAVALAPDIVIDQEARFVEVEAGHNLARGQTLVDYRSYSPYEANAQLIRAVNTQKFHDLLRLATQPTEGGDEKTHQG